MDTLKELRATVDTLMRASHETQWDVGRAIGITQAQVSRKQSGGSMWTLKDCDRLAGHYRITVPQLLSGRTAALEAAWGTIKGRLLAAGAEHEGQR